MIIETYNNAINIFSNRAEPYLELGTYYNQNRRYEEAYELLIKAKSISYDEVKELYLLFFNYKSYGKYINDELAVSCYWIGKYEYSITLIKEIIEDPEFIQHKERLTSNLNYALDKIKEKNEIHENDNKITIEELPLIINI